MMDCIRCNELMNLAIDNMLSPDELQEFEAHIAGCADCQVDYELYKSIQKELLLMGDDEVDLPDGFHESLMNSIKEEGLTETTIDKVVPLWKKVNRRYMNVAAALVLVVVFGLIGINNLDEFRSNNDYEEMKDSTMMEKPAMEKSAKMDVADEREESAMEPKMEAAPEMAMESAEVEKDSATKEETKEDKAASDSEPGVASEDTDNSNQDATTETTVMTSSEEPAEDAQETAEDGLMSTDETASDEEETLVTVFSVTEEEEPDVMEGETQLARDDNAPEKAPKSVDNNLSDYEEAQPKRDGVVDAIPGLWLYIIGSFVGIVMIGGSLILKKNR